MPRSVIILLIALPSPPEASTELRQAIDAPEPVMQLTYHPAHAAVAALHAANPLEAATRDVELHRVS